MASKYILLTFYAIKANVIVKMGTPSCNKPLSNLQWESCSREGYTDMWFGMSQTETTATGALDACQDAGGQFISIWNSDIDFCTKNLLKNSKTHPPPVDAFIGAVWETENSEWRWADFHTFDYNSCLKGQCQATEEKRCLKAIYDPYINDDVWGDNYFWMPSDCSEEDHFVCVYDCNPSTTYKPWTETGGTVSPQEREREREEAAGPAEKEREREENAGPAEKEREREQGEDIESSIGWMFGMKKKNRKNINPMLQKKVAFHVLD